MGNDKVLRERRKLEIDKADAIVALTETEQRGMTAAEKTDFDTHMAEVKRLEEELEASHRAKTAKDELDARKRYDVPAVAVPVEERAGAPQPPKIEVRENPTLAYQKGDGFSAILQGRLSYDAHQQHTAVREAEKLYGSGSWQVRALQQSTFTAGGAFIPENFVGAEFIEALRAVSAFRSAGPRMVQLTNGSFTTPRLTGSTSVTYIGTEGDNLATTEPTFGQLKLVEKKVGAIVPFSNDLRRNASIDAIRVVTEDLIRTVAIDEDTQVFNGAGTVGVPKGIYNWVAAAQKSNQTGATLANVRTDIRKAKNGLDSANVPYVRRAWFMHSRTMNFLGWDMVDGNGNFAFPSLQSAQGASLGGDPVSRDNVLSITLGGSSNQSQTFYVEMSECYLADSMEMDLQIFENAAYNTGTSTIRSGISRDESVIRLIRKWDFGMRHTSSAYIIEQVDLGS